MGGERELVGGHAVIPAAVDAFVVELHRARLRRDELESLQEPRRQAWMATYGGPLFTRETIRLAQDGGVDRDLAEVVEARGPSQPVDVRERQAQRARKLIHVRRDAHRVPVGRRIAFVDDVRERLERTKRLPLHVHSARLRLVNDERDGNHDDDVPRMQQRKQGGRSAECELAEGRREMRIEAFATNQDVEEERTDRQVREADGRERDEVLEQLQFADRPAGDAERNARSHGCRGRGTSTEERVAVRPRPERGAGEDADCGDQRSDPRAEHEESRDVHGRRELGSGCLGSCLRRRGGEERCGGERGVGQAPDARRSRSASEQDRAEDGKRWPHETVIGREPAVA